MRAQVVLLDGDRILLACHRGRRGDYWVLPGGSVEATENPEEAAVRETREETGLEVALERLLFVDAPRTAGDVVITSPRYTYLARIVGGELCQVEDRENGSPEKGYLVGARWQPFEAAEYDAATRDTLQRVISAL